MGGFVVADDSNDPFVVVAFVGCGGDRFWGDLAAVVAEQMRGLQSCIDGYCGSGFGCDVAPRSRKRQRLIRVAGDRPPTIMHSMMMDLFLTPAAPGAASDLRSVVVPSSLSGTSDHRATNDRHAMWWTSTR